MLRNKFTTPEKPYGEADPVVFRMLEETATAIRLAELAGHVPTNQFDYDHMKEIHRYVFQDVYDWAGQERVAPVRKFLTKDGHAYYPAGQGLTEAAEKQYSQIVQKNFLCGLEHNEFVDELAEIWGELNVIHSFREGNTRTQFVFFSQLSEHAGYRFDMEKFAPRSPLRDEFIAARFHGQDTGSNACLAEVLREGIIS